MAGVITSPRTDFARHGWIGLTLVAVCWPANWFVPGLRTHLLFAPLWLGFILTIDAVTLRRTGASIIARSWRDFLLLFVVSAPFWWLFELFNHRTGNWIYIGRGDFSALEYFFLASVSFSTVVPAVFEAAELVSSARFMSRFSATTELQPSPPLRILFVLLGLSSLVLVWTWPTVFYPLLWGVVFFLVEPLNQWIGRPSLFRYLRIGDWRPAVSLALGAILCGFFWELWNSLSFPKWTYNTPGVDFLRIFEMPVLGYLGYLPFGLELFALTSLVLGREVIAWEQPNTHDTE